MYSLEQLRAFPKDYVRERVQARIADDERRGSERGGRSEYLMFADFNRRVAAEHRPANESDGARCTGADCGQVWPCTMIRSVFAHD